MLISQKISNPWERKSTSLNFIRKSNSTTCTIGQNNSLEIKHEIEYLNIVLF